MPDSLLFWKNSAETYLPLASFILLFVVFPPIHDSFSFTWQMHYFTFSIQPYTKWMKWMMVFCLFSFIFATKKKKLPVNMR